MHVDDRAFLTYLLAIQTCLHVWEATQVPEEAVEV